MEVFNPDLLLTNPSESYIRDGDGLPLLGPRGGLGEHLCWWSRINKVQSGDTGHRCFTPGLKVRTVSLLCLVLPSRVGELGMEVS